MKELFTAAWHEALREELCNLVWRWSEINSGSHNLLGLAAMAEQLQTLWRPLADDFQIIQLPARSTYDNFGDECEEATGKALLVRKRADAPFRLLFVGHMDTVFESSSSFQRCSLQDEKILRGPGVADMKGGLAIMYGALRAYEQWNPSKEIGWEVLLTPDEEVGSVGSAPLLIEAARRCDVGLVFEPAFADGALVSSRKSSANLCVIAYGKSAHAGRHFHEGRNAITALARFVTLADGFNSSEIQGGVTLNVGKIWGGTASNVVAERAICHINIRGDREEEVLAIEHKLEDVIQTLNSQSDVLLKLKITCHRSHKIFDAKSQQLFDLLQQCNRKLGYAPLSCRPSGGVCDGNILASQGLPTLDTLGAIGGQIHTDEEYLVIDSLSQRAALVAQFLNEIGDLRKGL